MLLFWACNIAPAISIHALLTESDFQRSHTLVPLHISIHALLTESDQCQRGCFCDTSNFYPRSPYGERRHDGPLRWVDMDFYPRSPYGERLQRPQAFRPSQHFYPRSPYGERHRYGRPIDVQLVFLSALSLRRATHILEDTSGATYHFYPRSPYGERLYTMTTIICTASFLSTLSLRRATNAVRIA